MSFRNECAISIIIFTSMAIESFVNDYIVRNLGDNVLDSIDKLDIKNKFLISLRLVTGKEYSKGKEGWNLLVKLVNVRNKLTHDKPKVIKDKEKTEEQLLKEIGDEYGKRKVGIFDKYYIDKVIQTFNIIINEIKEIDKTNDFSYLMPEEKILEEIVKANYEI